MSKNMDNFVPSTPPALFIPKKKETQPKLSLSDMLAAKEAAKLSPKQSVADSEMSGTANTYVFGAASNASSPSAFRFGAMANSPMPTSTLSPDMEKTRKLEKELKRLTHEQNESLKELKRERAINAKTIADLTMVIQTAEDSSTQTIADLNAAIKTAVEEKNEFERNYLTVFDALTRANDTADEANYHADQCDDQIKRLEREKKNQNTINRRLNEVINNLRAKVVSLEEKVDSLEDEMEVKLGDIQVAETEITVKTEELKVSQGELEAFKLEASGISFNHEQKNAGDRLRALEGEHQELANKFQELGDEKAKLMVEGQTILNERDQLKLQLNDATVKFNTLQQDHVRVQAEITQAQPRVWELQQTANRATALDMENESLTEKLEQANCDLAQIKLNHTQAIEAKDRIISESGHALLDSNLKDTSNVQSEFHKTIEELQAKILDQATAHQNDIALFEAKIAELSEGQEAKLLSLLDSYKSIVTKKEEIIAQANAQAKSADKDVASLKFDLSIAKGSADALQLKVDTLQGDLGASHKTVLSLQSEAKHVRTEFDVLKDEMTSTRTLLDDISRKTESANKQLAEKKEELAAERNAHEATKAMHAASIDRLAKDKHKSDSVVAANSRQRMTVPRRTALRPIRSTWPVITEEEPEFINEDVTFPVIPTRIRGCRCTAPATIPRLDFEDEKLFSPSPEVRVEHARFILRQFTQLTMSPFQFMDSEPANVTISDSIPKAEEPVVKVDLPQATEEEKQNAEAPIPSLGVVVVAVPKKKHVRAPSAICRFSLVLFFLFVISLIAMSTKVAPTQRGPVLSIGMTSVAARTATPVISTVVSTDPIVATVTTVATVVSVEEPKSTELVAPVSWDKVSLQVLYPTRILHLGERVLESTFHYWKALEVRILRVVNLFRRGG
ncbi:ccbb046c-ec4e-4371-bc0a-c879242015ec [Sclerotinia trifoliorum]|uniref:Ccbb046c-ec4e-4371-bc0a-c879242015ec n=1 Tax=Sclerotinia trifoliorum TaxID=28548 RepID=A0A8H2W5D6_9HELO|nr:ccbb046c-ec4e-4371-bc0a-c879242015ec [Sclerotinia trifoliorum]